MDALIQAFGKSAIGTILFDGRLGRLIAANAAAERMLSLPLADLKGLETPTLCHLSREEFLERVRKNCRGGPPLRMVIHAGSESEKHFELHCGGPLPGSARAFYAMLQDVSSRAKAERALEWRVRLETLVLSLSSHFLNLHGERVDSGIQYALRSLGKFAGADRAYIFLFSDDNQTVSNTHEWCEEGIFSQRDSLQNLKVSTYPWFMERIQTLRAVHIPRTSALGANALPEKKEFAAGSIQSLLAVPMVFRGLPRGYLGFDSVQTEKAWPEDIIALLRVAGELFISAIERRRTDEALLAAHQRYHSLFENTVEGVFQSTPQGRFITVNPALATILGYGTPTQLMEEALDIGLDIYVDPSRRQDLLTLLEKEGQVIEFESQARRRDGKVIWITENARVSRDTLGHIALIEGTVMDVSERKRLEAQMAHDALHDTLTGLPNRTLLLERLGRVIDRRRRRHGAHAAVLLLDLDRFKTVNDGMGHGKGDMLLMEVAHRLEKVLPPGSTLARLGGDEFAVLLEDLVDAKETEIMAVKVLGEFALPFSLEGQEMYATASMGVAAADPNYLTPEDVLRDADIALHQAKGEGKARYSIFDASMHQRAVKRLHIENDLRKALERHEFFLVYQPIVELKEAHLAGFEALVRWRHPEKGVVPPIDFIPIAEETGIIVPLGRWVLEEACRQLHQWQVSLPQGRDLTMSINISCKQFEGLVLAGEIESICRNAGVKPHSLKLEITESAIIQNPEMAASVLKELKEKGFKLSLDDFGTGYSSLSYLHRFPFHTLKIDRSFISKLEQDEKNDEIVKIINTMARNLGMDVTAEGVETEQQWERLRVLETPYGQGYFFSKPLMADDARIWIEKLPSLT